MVNSNCISVTVQNTSAETLYIGLNRADNLWLSGLNSNAQSWVEKFDQATCVKEMAANKSYTFDFPEYDTGVGCRMYISAKTLTGVPNLTTDQFIYDKVEMGWNATWNQTSVDFFAIPLQLSVNNEAAVGYKSDVTRAAILSELAQTPAPYNTFQFPTDGKPEIYRYFSPAMASSMTAPPWQYDLKDCLGEAISVGLPLLANYSGTFNYGGFQMSNFAVDGTNGLTVTCNSEKITLSDIDSAKSFSNTLDPNPNDAAGQKVAGIIGCALNWGISLTGI